MRTYATIDRRLEMSLLSKTMKEDQEDLMTIEQRLDTLERRVSRYRSATMVMALLLVAGVTMGQTTRDATFGEVTCNTLTVVKGFRPVAQLEGWEGGGGRALHPQRRRHDNNFNRPKQRRRWFAIHPLITGQKTGDPWGHHWR